MDAPWRSPPPDEASDSSSVVPGSPMPATPLHGEEGWEVPQEETCEVSQPSDDSELEQWEEERRKQ